MDDYGPETYGERWPGAYDEHRGSGGRLRRRRGRRHVPARLRGAQLFFALLTQDDQVRCFENVAQRLAGGGVFVVEAFVPDLGRFDRGQRVGALAVGTDGLHLDAARHDPAAQRVDGLHVIVEDGGVRTYPVRIRYAWPSELDLMARLAGLRLRDRWGGWDGEPFTAASGRHVNVYERG